MEPMFPEKTVINIANWDRNEAFYIFKDFDIPYTNLCSNIDITNFMSFIRKNNYHFYAALLFFIGKAANVIQEFRYRFDNDVPIMWSKVAVNYTLMQETGVLGNNCTDFADDFFDFYARVTEDLENAKKSGHIFNKQLPGNAVINVTSIPWTHLTNFSQAMYRIKDAVPYIGVGRRFGQDSRILIPVAVQVHHAFVDGFQISQYFKLLELMLSAPKHYLNLAIAYEELLDESRPFILSEKDKPYYTL